MINYTDDHKNDEIVEKIVHLHLIGNSIEKKFCMIAAVRLEEKNLEEKQKKCKPRDRKKIAMNFIER